MTAGHPHNFLESGRALFDLFPAVLPEPPDPFFSDLTPDLGRFPALAQGLLQVVVEWQELKDARASEITGLPAMFVSSALPQSQGFSRIHLFSRNTMAFR